MRGGTAPRDPRAAACCDRTLHCMLGTADQVVRTDPTNILIRSLQRNAKKDKAPARGEPQKKRANNKRDDEGQGKKRRGDD